MPHISDRFVVAVAVSDDLQRIIRGIAQRAGVIYRSVPSRERLAAELRPTDVAALILEDPREGDYSRGLHWPRSPAIPHPPLLVVREPRLESTVAAMQHGIYSVHRFSSSMDDLEESVLSALSFSTRIARAIERWQQAIEQLDTLSEGEICVLRYLLEGLLNKRIASRLDISERTVEARRKRIFEKTGTSSVAELVRLIVETVGVEEVIRRCHGPATGPPQPHWRAGLVRTAVRLYAVGSSSAGPASKN